jgi:cytolysin (calcineurin-like family phosphatase)
MVTFTNLAGIGSHMQPAGALVFVEESYASINDGYWIQNLDQPTMWIDDPANYHLNACSLTFADGHCQSRTWTDKNVLAGVWNNYIGFPCDPTSPDLAWVQARCTVLSPAP